MGNAVTRIVTKPFRSFNVDNRARRVIEKAKPTIAPRHSNFEDAIPPEMRDDIRRKITTKSEELHERLRNVRVASAGDNPDAPAARSLPQARASVEVPEYGFDQPKVVPKGRISLADATAMLGKHATNPSQYDAAAAAQEYNLEVADADNMLKYFIPLMTIDTTDKKAVQEFLRLQEEAAKKDGFKELPSR